MCTHACTRERDRDRDRDRDRGHGKLPTMFCFVVIVVVVVVQGLGTYLIVEIITSLLCTSSTLVSGSILKQHCLHSEKQRLWGNVDLYLSQMVKLNLKSWVGWVASLHCL